MRTFFSFITDSKNRPAIEAILGFVYLISALVYILWVRDIVVFSAVAGVGGGLLGVNAWTNMKLDSLPVQKESETNKAYQVEK